MDAFVGILLVAYIGAVYSKPDLKREWTGCYSPQYVEIGETGYVHCQFPSKFNAIYWYENATDGNIVPVLSYSHLVKTGSKYESGEYDILSNGSLVIKNVSIYHERTFKVMCIDEGDLSRSFVVFVQTTVTSSKHLPTIQGCNPEEPLCLLNGKDAGFSTCRYEGSRPPVHLQWFERSANHERKVESITWSIADSKFTFTTISNISLNFAQNRFLVVLVCQVLNIPLGFSAGKEALVDLTEDDRHNSKTYEAIPFPINSRATFQCSIREKEASFIWKADFREKFDTVAFSVMGKTNSVMDGFTITEFGDLVVENVEMRHEGNYTCFYDKDSSISQKTISLFVVVPPTYPYVSIDECKPTGTCIINASSQGLLTCRVSGIRPAVSLTWSQKSDNGNIRLTEGKEVIVRELDLSSVSLTLFYVFSDNIPCGQKVNLQCQAEGMGARFLASRTTEVIVIKDHSPCHKDVSESGSSINAVIAVIVAIAAMLCLVLLVFILYQCGSLQSLGGRRRKFSGTEEEQIQLQGETNNQQGRQKREKLISHLRRAYDYEKNTNDVYIVSDFSKMDPSKISSDERRFMLMNTYHELFTDEHILSKRRIVIEGEAGCGKSMFGRHVADEWSRGDRESPLRNFPILILLSLTNFTKETTIYKAIIDQTLPEDCKDLNADVLESLLGEEKQYILFLDGFDEFSERQEKDLVGSVVHKIMGMKVMTNALVYLLTRSVSSLRVFGTKQFPIVRLQPFNSDQRNRYLEKRFRGKNKLKDAINGQLKGNEYLASLCKIPLFLNMITDMYSTEHPGKLPTRTMTAFFDKLLQCRYSRCLEIRKPVDIYAQKDNEECKQKAEYKQNHFKPSQLIAKFAFGALKDKKGIWETSHFDQLGKEISIMINMKILTEIRENVFTPSQPALIKFAHNLYHYYIAAHHIASLEEDNTITDTIKQLDPLTSLHVFIFSCGINNKVVRPIVGYLLELDDMYPYPLSDCICHCLSETVDYGSIVNSENQTGRCFSDVYFKEQTENLGNNDVEHGDLVPEFSNLLTDFCRRDHGMELRNSDEYYLTSAKSSLLTVCTDKKIRVNILRLVNVVSQLWDGSIHFDVGRNRLSGRIPLIHTCLMTDYRENLNEHQVLSLIKDIPTLRELCVFSLATPRLIKDEIISCLKMREEENIKIFVIWLTYTSLDANGDVFFSYPSTTFRCWMNTLETAIVTIIRKPQDALKMIENDKLKSFAAKRLLKNRKIFGDISEQVAVKIMKDKGLLHLFRHTGFPRPLQKIFMDELRRFNDVLKDIMDFWQKLDDASTHEEVNFFSQGLSDKIKNLPFSLRLFLNEEGDLKEDNKEKEEGDLKERTTSNTAENNETVVWQKGRQNIVSFLKPLYFYFQV